MNRFWRLAGPVGLLAATLLLSSCGLFGDDKDKEAEPKELVKLKNKLKIKKLWSTKVGGSSEYLLVGLRPAGDGNRIYAASQDGKLLRSTRIRANSSGSLISKSSFRPGLP